MNKSTTVNFLHVVTSSMSTLSSRVNTRVTSLKAGTDVLPQRSIRRSNSYLLRKDEGDEKDVALIAQDYHFPWKLGIAMPNRKNESNK